MESLTFEQFEDQVMAAFEQWPLRLNDASDQDTVYYSFETVNATGFEGTLIDGVWCVSSKLNYDYVTGETLEAALESLTESAIANS